MKVRWKAAILALLCTCAAVFVLTVIVHDHTHILDVVIPQLEASQAQLEPIAAAIRRHGVTDQLGDILRERAMSQGWTAAFVIRQPDQGPDAPWKQPIEVSYPTKLIGHTVRDAPFYVPSDWRHVPATQPVGTIVGPDGTTFEVWIGQAVAIPWPVMQRVTRYAPGVCLALLWLAIAAWIFLDTLERSTISAPWVLLSLLTGPLALAVWLIYSRSPGTKAGAGMCPGCGQHQVRGTAFCVHCGYALKPACPDCRRPVEPEWTFCGACGSSLSE